MLRTASTHTHTNTHPCPPPGVASQPWYSPQDFKIKQREKRQRKKKKQRESKRAEIKCILKHLLNHATVHYSYVCSEAPFSVHFNDCFLLVLYRHFPCFLLFFLMFAQLSVSRERNHSTWGIKGEKRREEKDKGEGLQTTPDMSPVFLHCWQVTGSVSSVCGLCCCQESIEEGGEREGRSGKSHGVKG